MPPVARQRARRQGRECRTGTFGGRKEAAIALVMHDQLNVQGRQDSNLLQGRQDSNLQPPVLETGALPVELRPSVRGSDCTPGLAGTPFGMSEQADQFDEREDDDVDELQEPQQDKGYGEDEGERDAALDEEQ